DYFYRDGFHIQNFRSAIGGDGADGGDLRRVLFAPETAARSSRWDGSDRHWNCSRLAAWDYERQSAERELHLGTAGVHRWVTLGSAHASRVSQLFLGDFPHGDFQRRWVAAEYRKRRSRRRPLPNISIADGERYRFGNRGAFRQRVSHDDLYRPPGLETARRAFGLFGSEWHLYQSSLFYRHDSSSARTDSIAGRHRNTSLHRHHHRRQIGRA